MSSASSSDRFPPLRRAGLLDASADEAFDRLTRLAARLLDTPMASVSLVDDEQPFVKSTVEIRDDAARTVARHVAAAGEPLLVEDMRRHPRMADDATLRDAGLVACAGVPLILADGVVVGTLCVADTHPRTWDARDVAALRDLAGACTTEVTLRVERLDVGHLRAALQGERDRIGALFEQSPSFIAWGRGPNHVFEGANRAYYQLVGFRDIIGKPVAEALPEMVDQGIIEMLDRVRATGEPFVADGMRLLVQRTPGAEPEECFANFVYQPIVDPDGTRSGIFCHGVDVTAQVRAVMAARRGEEAHRDLLDTLPLIVYRTESRPPYPVIFVNRAVEMLGYTRDEWLARDDAWQAVLHPDDRERVLRDAEESYRTGTQIRHEYRVIARNGDVHWVQDRGQFLPPGGDARECQGIMLDITAQRATEEAIRFQAHLLDTVEQAIIATDPAGRITYCNAFAQRLYGFTSAELVGRSLIDLAVPADAPAFAERFHDVVGQVTSWTGEIQRYRGDGSAFTAHVTASPICDADGRVVGVVSISSDATERRFLEEQLRQSQKMEAVGRLAGGIAHDFNNLLTVIKGSSGFLLEELDAPDPRREDVLHIAEAAERAAALTRQLLAFSRRQILDPSVLDLNVAVQNLLPMLDRLIGEDIAVVTVLGESLGRVMADVGQIEQVLVNLAVNARDAMPDGGRIVIETRNVTLDDRYAAGYAESQRSVVLPGDYVMLAVSDTGTGMSPAVRARVFEPFYTTKETGKGTGLGLSTVYGIVKQSGGHVWVYSEPGEGSVFKIYFPRLAAPAASSLVHADDARPARGSETILLAEDEDQLRALARRVLERHGYTVLESRNGREALANATQYEGQIHLVLTDVVMPEMSGRGLVERLRAVRPNAAVVYMSGYTDDDVLRRGMVESSSHFVQKPFAPAELLRVVRETLDERA